MPYNLLDIAERKALINEIKGNENIYRKRESFKQNEVFSDRITKYVIDYLRGQFSNQTVQEMPIISTVNICRRIVKQEASIYKKSPERDWSDVSDEQKDALKLMYADMMADIKLNKSNEYFKLQKQNILQILPKDGKLALRVLRPDQVDVVPDPMNPEKPWIYIISAYDRFFESERADNTRLSNGAGGSFYSQGANQDFVNQKIADADDYEGPAKLFTVWSPEYNFVMDQNGNIVSGDNIENPIAPYLPFVDIAEDRDFEYWVRQSQSLTDFTIQYNGALSDQGQVVRLQGFAQAVIKAPQDLLPVSMQIGPNTILRLPVDPANPVETDFSFVSPSPDIAGGMAYIEMLLANFLSSRGNDPKIISGKADSTKYSSGIERLLAMIEKFEATRTDYSLYEKAEQDLYTLIKIWHNTIKGSDQLLPKYETADFSEDSEVTVQFAKPELVKTDAEVLDVIERKMDLGLMSRVEALMELRNLDDEEHAEEILEKIEEQDALTRARPVGSNGPEVNPGFEQGDGSDTTGSEPEVSDSPGPDRQDS